jgi:hypothetical protein
MFTTMGKLLYGVGDTDFLLGNFKNIKLTPETESTEVTGFYQDVAQAATLATIAGARTWKVAISVPVMTPALTNYFVFGVKLPETVTNLVTFSSKLVTCSSTASTPIALPAGATVKAVTIANLGQEAPLAMTTDYTVASNTVTVLHTGAGSGKRVAVIYSVSTASAAKIAQDAPLANRYTGTLKLQYVAFPYGAANPYLFVAEDVSITNPPEMSFGEVGETTLEGTLNASTGTPFYYVPLTTAMVTNLSI